MNKEVKAKWLSALRSGEYKQATHFLYDNQKDGYCCIGVLCDLSPDWDWASPDVDNCTGIVPDRVAGWAGMEDEYCHLTYRGKKRDASGLNDDVGLTFAQIAYLIEEQL